MLAKNWKRICFFVLIVACLFNVIGKIVRKTSVKDELQASADYVQSHQQEKEQTTN